MCFFLLDVIVVLLLLVLLIHLLLIRLLHIIILIVVVLLVGESRTGHVHGVSHRTDHLSMPLSMA